MRTIAGETVVVPTGEAAARMNGMITLNETGAKADIDGFTDVLLEHRMLEA